MRARAVALAVLLCTAVSACGLRVGNDPPEPTAVTPAPTAAADYLAVADNTHASLLGGRRFADTNQGALVGPDFQLRQRSAGVVSEISPGVGRRLGLSGGLRAADGYELLVADFASVVDYTYDLPENGHLPGAQPKSGKGYAAWLVVGEKARKLEVDLHDGDLLIASVPVGEPVSLRVEDDGRRQSLDLRTGKRAEDALSRYYPIQDWTPDKGGGFVGDGYADLGENRVSVVDASVVTLTATLSPFTPSGRWARSGRAWLYVTVQVNTPCWEPYRCRVRISPDEQLRLVPSGREKPRIVGSAFHTSPMDQPTEGSGLETLAFEIPAKTRWATLTVTLTGPLLVQKVSGGKVSKTMRLKWREQPRGGAFRLAPDR